MAESEDGKNLGPGTRLVHAGRDRDITGLFVNPPVVHGTTVLFETADDLVHGRQRYTYGRRKTPTIEALQSAMNSLENAAGTVICPSGLAAVSTALLSCLGSGDRILITDSVYEPVRRIADRVLTRLGIETVYYDPAIGAGIEALFDDRTRAVYVESPGTLTFDVQDLPAIAEVAHAREAVVLFDNTWASPLHFRPLDFGADLVIEAGTKYLGGHSDAFIGTVSANARAWPALLDTHGTLGVTTGPDDIFLTLRGLRTMEVRLKRHAESALKVAEWLAARAEIARVLYPPLADDPGHALWKRDMTGAGGLLSVTFHGWSEDRVHAMMDALKLFGRGWSWGGYESLASCGDPSRYRTATTWNEGMVLRLYIGLEDPDDLIADLDAGFAAAASLP